MLLLVDPRNASTDPFRLGDGRDADGRAATALAVRPDDFCGWLAKAMPGDATVYYRGHIGRDRCRSTTALSERDRQRLNALARQALLAAGDGRVHLLQRRHGNGDYSYIAVKASGPAPARTWVAGTALPPPVAPPSRGSDQPRNGKGDSQCL